MPNYRYQCLADGCGQEFEDTRAMHDRQNATCPNCMAWGGDLVTDDHGVPHFVIEIMVGHVMPEYRARDIVELEGSLDHGGVPMPSLGPNVNVRTEQQRQEALKRTREAYYKETDGDHSVLRPFKNDRGEIEYDYQTTRSQGVDLGEIVDNRELEVGQTLIDRAITRNEKVLEDTGGRVPLAPARQPEHLAKALRAQVSESRTRSARAKAAATSKRKRGKRAKSA